MFWCLYICNILLHWLMTFLPSNCPSKICTWYVRLLLDNNAWLVHLDEKKSNKTKLTHKGAEYVLHLPYVDVMNVRKCWFSHVCHLFQLKQLPEFPQNAITFQNCFILWTSYASSISFCKGFKKNICVSCVKKWRWFTCSCKNNTMVCSLTADVYGSQDMDTVWKRKAVYIAYLLPFIKNGYHHI